VKAQRLWRRRSRTRVVAVSALLAVALAGAGEFTARQLVRDRVAAAAPALGSRVTVGASGGPLLWDLANRNIPQLDISSDDAQVGPLSGVAVRARLDDVRLGGTATDRSTRVELSVPVQSIGAALGAAAPNLPVTSVTADPAAGTIQAVVGPGGLGRLILKPVLQDGRATLAPTRLTVFGRDVPSSELGAAGSGLGASTGPAAPYPLGLTVASVTVMPTGLRVVLTGGPSTLGPAR